MSKIIEKTVVSKYAPHDTNVDWLDVSGDKPVKKSYINGKWVEVGGGSDYPTPTAGDVNKVWQVTPVQKGTKTEETVIVPEQTLVEGQELEYNDKFVPGAQCIAVIDGVEYRGEVFEDEDLYVFVGEFGIFEYNYEAEEFNFYNRTEFPEVTAKLLVIGETPIYDYNWAPGVKIPIPTAEDEGKILVVTKVEDKENSNEYELAPKQTVTIIEESVILQNTSNLDKFVEGATVTSVINGITYTGQVMNGDGILYVEIGDDDAGYFLGLIENGTKLLFTGSPETYEISVSVLGKEYSYEYQLQSGGSGGSEKVVTLENWADVHNGGESILTDIDGNKFYEGQDFTIEYNTGVSSNNPFDRINTIEVSGNYQCDKIVIVKQSGQKYIKIPVFINTDSKGNNYAVFGDTGTNYIGTLVVE